MSRPQINVRVSASLLEAWEQATAHTNASAIIRRAMRQYIKEQTSRDVADDIGYKRDSEPSSIVASAINKRSPG